MLRPALKFSGFDFVPKEYFFWAEFRGDDFSSMKSVKKAKTSFFTK